LALKKSKFFALFAKFSGVYYLQIITLSSFYILKKQFNLKICLKYIFFLQSNHCHDRAFAQKVFLADENFSGLKNND
jgi:hypothetical protein